MQPVVLEIIFQICVSKVAGLFVMVNSCRLIALSVCAKVACREWS